MRRIIYASRSLHDFQDSELLALLQRARDANDQRGVTGMLVYASCSFLQLFEGDHTGVEAIWDRIRTDPRHTDLRILEDGPANERRFAGWSMGFDQPDGDLLEETLPGYRAATEYPFISSQLVATAETAETLLSLYARRSG